MRLTKARSLSGASPPPIAAESHGQPIAAAAAASRQPALPLQFCPEQPAAPLPALPAPLPAPPCQRFGAFTRGSLRFAPVEPRDAAWLHKELFSCPAVLRWYRNGRGRTLPETEVFVAQGAERWARGEAGGWMVHSQGAPVGRLGVAPTAANPAVLEVGYAYIPACWGQGIATRALGAGLQWLRAAPQPFDTLFATAHPDNPASNRVLEKNGFRLTHSAARQDYDDAPRNYYHLSRNEIPLRSPTEVRTED